MPLVNPGPDPVRRASLAQQVAESLRNAILDGRIAGGSVLRQTALARELGTSVIPLREALRRLEGEGLLHHEAHRGVVVARFDAEDVRELVEICGALEALAFPRALPNVQPDDLVRAESVLAALRDEHDLARFADLAWELRAALLRPARSPRLMQQLELLSKTNRRYWAPFLRDPTARAWILEHWRRLIDCVRRADLDDLLRQLERAQSEGVALGKTLLPPTPSEPRVQP